MTPARLPHPMLRTRPPGRGDACAAQRGLIPRAAVSREALEDVLCFKVERQLGCPELAGLVAGLLSATGLAPAPCKVAEAGVRDHHTTQRIPVIGGFDDDASVDVGDGEDDGDGGGRVVTWAYDARLEALAREVKETEALLRIEQNKRDARLHAAERARKGEHDSAAIVRESSEKVPRWLATLGELHGEVQESVVESKARCDELCEGQEESLQRSFATRIKHAYKEVEAMRKARNERCLGWIDRSEEGERDLAWSRDTLDLYKKQAEKLASINKVVRERAAKACRARKELIAELVAEKQKRDQLQQRLRELNADTFEAAEAPAPAAEEEAVPSPEVLTLQAEIRGAKRKLVKARSDYNQDFQEQAELRSLLDAFDRGLRARLDDALKATTRPRTVGRTAKAASPVTRAQSAAASPGSRRPKVGDEIRLQLKVVAQLRELTFPPPPDLLEAARRPGPRRRSPVMKKPQPPLGRRPATGKAPTASTSLRDTRRPETAGAISRPLLASMLATRTTKYL